MSSIKLWLAAISLFLTSTSLSFACCCCCCCPCSLPDKSQSPSATPATLPTPEVIPATPAPQSIEAMKDPAIFIDDCKTIVSESTLLTGKIDAIVHLSISKLTLSEEAIRGFYKVDVDMSDIPAALRLLARSKNETGTITLPTKKTLAQIGQTGDELVGEGFCADKKETRKIICTISPYDADKQIGTIQLVIDSGKRVMEFRSSYTLHEDTGEAASIEDFLKPKKP